MRLRGIRSRRETSSPSYQRWVKSLSLLFSTLDSHRQFPDLQLEYMAKMMDRSRNPSESLSDELKLKYLELKCQLEPDSVVHDLQNFIFPLEESLKICERFDNLYGQAHLKSRTRNIDGAIRIYMRVVASEARS